jgi:hypothetical protein
MARSLVKNPGKTARYYRSNPEARAKHRRDELQRGRSQEKRSYRACLLRERRKRGIDGKGGPDMSHQPDGSLKPESLKINRARGGALRK